MKPTLALIGEQAPRVPEVVAPLDRLLDIFRVALSPLSQAMLAPAAGGGGDITVNISGNNFTIREEADIERVGRKMVDLIRLRQGLRV